jgi:hypothetical protein
MLEAPHISLEQLLSEADSPTSELLRSAKALPTQFKALMNDMEISDAVASILDTLKLVSPVQFLVLASLA